MARTAPLLPPKEGRERIIHSVPPLAQGPAVPSLSSKNNSLSSEFSGPRVDSVRRIASSLSPATLLPAAKRVRFGDAVLPHAPLASPYRDSGSSARMSQNAGPSVPSSLTPIRCTTAGTSIVPLEPLARRLEAWLAQPSPSRWLTRTIRLGYAIQFARRPPKFSGVLETAVQLGMLLSCARRLLSSWQGCNRAGPSSRDEAGVLQPLFHRTQGRRWYSTNPGL